MALKILAPSQGGNNVQIGGGSATSRTDTTVPKADVADKAISDGNGNNIVGTYETKADAQLHKENYNNPHQTDKSQVGLGNVDNTSDLDKPISNATQSALDSKLDLSGGTLTGPLYQNSLQSSSAHTVSKTLYRYIKGGDVYKISIPLQSIPSAQCIIRITCYFGGMSVGGSSMLSKRYLVSLDTDIGNIYFQDSVVDKISGRYTNIFLDDFVYNEVDSTLDTRIRGGNYQRYFKIEITSNLKWLREAALLATIARVNEPPNLPSVQYVGLFPYNAPDNVVFTQKKAEFPISVTSANFIGDLVGTADSALADGSGRSIINTYETIANVNLHKNAVNPHNITPQIIGLGNVDNTSDATKNSAVATLDNKTIDGGTF